MRAADVSRITNETRVTIRLELDGTGQYEVATGVGFLDHMLALFCGHGRFNLTARCEGDLHVDAHHTVEDVGIVLGMAFDQALGDRAGIYRYGSYLLPMDEALVQVALDISGRSHLSYGLELPSPRVGEFDTELTRDFFDGFTRALGLTLHLRQLAGVNTHHIIEAAFKGMGRALAVAIAIDQQRLGEIPSTKGVL